MGSELLRGFRMLDLADDKGALCGKIFADLGADVIKVEPPEGCPTRRMPPFLDDIPEADRSLHFIAYQAGKRSVTLNLGSLDGRALLEDLVRKSDFLLESFPVGYMDSIGLGYERLAELNPRLIYTSVTPFGDKGPGKHYKAYDIVSWASGGPMFLMGEPGKPPPAGAMGGGARRCRKGSRQSLLEASRCLRLLRSSNNYQLGFCGCERDGVVSARISISF
jgi:benzylsuccinate CoA-transferase BbsE subunit